MNDQLTQEITNQSNSLVSLMPKMQNLDRLMGDPIVTQDIYGEYLAQPPTQRDNWVKQNIDSVNLEHLSEINDLVMELALSMSAVFGSTEKIQNLMAAQQYQNLQAAQKPSTQATSPVESLE
jgi:hypothetical protein